jgi:hypothetical protein
MRSSPDDRAGSFFRSGARAAPDKAMSADAKVIWRKIVAGKPVDWFDAGSLPLLRLYCEALDGANRLSEGLAVLKVGSPAYRAALADWKIQCGIASNLSKQLRLGVQHAVERQAAKAGESAGEAQADALIGGVPAEPFRVVQ